MNRRWPGRAFIVFLCFLTSAAIAAEKPSASLGDVKFESIFVEVSDHDSNFTVVDARVDETGTAGVLFGVVGAGINSAANAGADDKKADTLRDAASAIDVKGAIDGALRARLAARADPPLAKDPESASHILLVEIRNWGLLRKSREDPRMRAFLNLTLSVRDAKGRTVWEKKRENSVGEQAAMFEGFTEERFRAEVEALAKKSGEYVANQIIYR